VSYQGYPTATTALQQEFWVAIQVRARTEIAVARQLKNKGYEEFLPTYTRAIRRNSHIGKADTPLFPGYVFCKYTHNSTAPLIVTTPGVIRILGTAGRPAAVSDHEICAIRAVVSAGIPCRPARFLRVGQPVRIVSGALEGVVGTIVNIKTSCRLILCIGLLKRAVSLDIGTEAVVALSP
jgi:transcription antitermination factor NusG